METREVKVGEVGFGGENPIRLQSMTTTDTMDIEGTVQQSIRMIDAGCELVRITAPSKKEAQALEPIKTELKAQGYDQPLVADIHFTPNAAEIAADYVEKVRVNPGNYADKKKFEELEYSDESYAAELERIEERFTPLVLKCKRLGRAMRIGTNHGSLSDRIMSRYGDTPLGMVESAMEFIRICEKYDYRNLVVSMKASNTQVMVQAYRLVVANMAKEEMNYPLHLGVTEAGEAEDGRIKSAVGIGTLLEDGIGDTVRVSLTEAPEAEIPVARKLVERYENGRRDSVEEVEIPIDPFSYKRRSTEKVLNVGGKNPPRVIADFSKRESITAANLFALGYQYSVPLDKWNIGDQACDFVYVAGQEVDFEIPGTLGIIQDFEEGKTVSNRDRHYLSCNFDSYSACPKEGLHFLFLSETEVDKALAQAIHADTVLILSTEKDHAMATLRAGFFKIINAGLTNPIVIKRSYSELDAETFMLHSSTDLGGLLLDGLGDGVMLSAKGVGDKKINETAFGILQATRTRISKTEYISCPSCGRTLFDLQETTAIIRSRTSHLKGIKIGIMGCIVNGPGEMADADYGYVGTGVGKITLYKEKDVVKRNVPSEEAVDELIELIKEHGDWVASPA